MLINYGLRYKTRGRWIFVPTEQCERKGRRIIKFFSHFAFPNYFYHYTPGGHIAAIHAHLQNKNFFKIDIQNFYYSIARMRVTRALRGTVIRAQTHLRCGQQSAILIRADTLTSCL